MLATQRDDCNHSRKPRKGHHKCGHCGRLSHKTDRCYVLHGHRPSFAIVVQIDLPTQSPTRNPLSSDIIDNSLIFCKFLKWYKDQQPSSTITFVARTCTYFVGLNPSSSLGPWILDSRATNHITSNKSLFSSLSSWDPLPSVTMTGGFRILAHCIGTVNLFPFYVLESPFNLLSTSRLTRW